MKLLDGKQILAEVKNEIALAVKLIIESGNRAPHLAAILVGTHGPSRTYVNAKVKACEQIGFGSTFIELPESTTEEELLAKVDELNLNPCIYEEPPV